MNLHKKSLFFSYICRFFILGCFFTYSASLFAQDNTFGDFREEVGKEIDQAVQNAAENAEDKFTTEIDRIETDIDDAKTEISDTIDDAGETINNAQELIEGGPDAVLDALGDKATEVIGGAVNSEEEKARAKAFEEEVKQRAAEVTGEAAKTTSADPSVSEAVGIAAVSDGSKLPHPWGDLGFNPNWEADWEADSIKAIDNENGSGSPSEKFLNCFEPRIIQNSCIYCGPTKEFRLFESIESCPKLDNTGEVWEYWWPEATVELNGFGTSAINTKLAGVEDLDRNALKRALIERFKPELATRLLEQLGIQVDAEEFKDIDDIMVLPLFGQNAVNDLGPAKFVSTEAHAYQTSIDKYGQSQRPETEAVTRHTAIEVPTPAGKKCMKFKQIKLNGYKYVKECFYNTLNEPSENIVHGWTEEEGLIDYWRFPERSDFVRSDYYQAARIAPIESKISDYLEELKTSSGIENGVQWLRSDTCASYRLTNFPVRFSSLSTLFNIKKRPFSMDEDPLRFQCYMEAELYPLTGFLPGVHPDHTSSAYLARKAIELISHRRDVLAGEKRRAPLSHFADWFDEPNSGLDKLQIVFPDNDSSCFNMKDVSEKSDFFDKMKFKPDASGSVRIVIWNKRTACTCPYRGFSNPNFAVPMSTLIQNAMNFFPIHPAYGCQTYQCNPEDALIDIPGPLQDILNEANNLINIDVKGFVKDNINQVIADSGIIPIDAIEGLREDLQGIKDQYQNGMDALDKPLGSVLDAKETELAESANVSGLIDSIIPLPDKPGLSNLQFDADDLIAQINKESNVSFKGEIAVETIIANSMSSLTQGAEFGDKNLIDTCTKLQGQVSGTKTTVKDAQEKAGDLVDKVDDKLDGRLDGKLDIDEENLNQAIDKIDLNKLNTDQIINVCSQTMREAASFSQAVNTTLKGVSENGQKVVVESITNALPQEHVNEWIFNSLPDIPNLPEELEGTVKDVSGFIDKLSAEELAVLDKLDSITNQATGTITDGIGELSDEAKARLEEAGIDVSQGLDQFVDLEALDIDLSQLDQFDEYLSNINSEKLSEVFTEQLDKLTSKAQEKLNEVAEKFAEKLGLGGGGDLLGQINQISSAAAQYSNFCLLNTYQMGDISIGKGDLPTGHEDAKVFGSEVLSPLGGFPNFCESVKDLFPFEHPKKSIPFS